MKAIVTAIALVFMTNALATAAGSPSVKPTVSKDVKAYNKGVELMMDKKFDRAEKQFRRALKANERFAEAHNNLAYTLRKQGPDHYDEALRHYNRAIELKPELNEPFMYRGVLHVQMGNASQALADHDTLLDRGSPLAAELKYVVENGREKEPEQFFGVTRKVNL